MPRKPKLEVEAAHFFKQLTFAPLDEQDPIAHGERRRLEYLQRAELIADEARANGMPELELKALAWLTRLTSLYKTKIDVSSSQLGLIKQPQTDRLTDAEIRKIEQADNLTDLSEIEGKIIKEQ